MSKTEETVTPVQNRGGGQLWVKAASGQHAKERLLILCRLLFMRVRNIQEAFKIKNSVCGFSKNWPFGPILSISINVHMWVYGCVCPVFEVPFEGLCAPSS